MNLKLLWVKGFLKGRREQPPMNLKPLMGEKIHSRKGWKFPMNLKLLWVKGFLKRRGGNSP